VVGGQQQIRGEDRDSDLWVACFAPAWGCNYRGEIRDLPLSRMGFPGGSRQKFRGHHPSIILVL